MKESFSTEELFYMIKKLSLNMTAQLELRCPGLFSGLYPETSSQRNISYGIVPRNRSVKANSVCLDQKNEKTRLS